MAWSKFFAVLTEAVSRHLGDFSRPTQIVKEAAARADAARLLAQGEREAEMIRRGELTAEAPAGLLRVPTRSSEARQLTYEQQVAARILHQELKRDHNLQKIVYYASQEEDAGQAAEGCDVDDAWLAQFFKNAEDVSSEQLQLLWARMLAGEVKTPGVYSIDTIDFLRRLTPTRANLIANIGPYVLVDDMIVRCRYLVERPWNNFLYWVELDRLGIIDRGLHVNLGKLFVEQQEGSIEYHGKALCFINTNVQIRSKLYIYRVTQLGKEVLSLGKFAPDFDYLTAVGREMTKHSLEVSIGDIDPGSPDGKSRVRNLKRIE